MRYYIKAIICGKATDSELKMNADTVDLHERPPECGGETMFPDSLSVFIARLREHRERKQSRAEQSRAEQSRKVQTAFA